MEVAPIFNLNRINSTGDSTPPVELTQAESKLKTACEDFEAIFLSYVLSQMRKSGETDKQLLNEKSTAMKIYKGMLDEEYAIKMARSGQIGIAQMLFEQLRGNLIQQTPETGEDFIQPADDGNLSAAIQSLLLNANLANRLAMTTSGNIENLTDNFMSQHLQSVINSQQSIARMLSEQMMLPENIENLTDNLINQHFRSVLDNQQSTISNLQAASNQQSTINSTDLQIGDLQPVANNQQSPSLLQTENRIMLQIVQKLSPTLQTGVREAIINLEPPDLGHLHIRLVLDGNNIMSARINVDSSSVANALNNNLSDLRGSLLNNHGIQIDSFNITVGTDLGQLNRGNGEPEQYQDNFRSSSIGNVAGTRLSESVNRETILTETRYFVNYLV